MSGDETPSPPTKSFPATATPDGASLPSPQTIPTTELRQHPSPLPGTLLPRAGDHIGDFQLLEVLGSGSFATVFLARQTSLGRAVALKVATSEDSEARTLAGLEHEHIVPVFSETIERERGLRLLCMKFVPGTDLERVRRELNELSPEAWSGQAILDAIDRLCRHEAMFDLAALRDRDALADSDFIEAVCWIGARLSEALAHAHSRGVLHRDVKPANILLNRYGQPLLSDFNLARGAEPGDRAGRFGGTLRYMAPEHLEAFRSSKASREAVDERSDLYGLGVVLYELLTGKPLMSEKARQAKDFTLIDALLEDRKASPASAREVRGEVPVAVDRAIRRCLEPDPNDRYQKAEDLAGALEGCRQLRDTERHFPPAMRLTRQALKHPVRTFLLMALVPHLLGSIVNIAYNTYAIVGHLTQPQQEAFTKVLVGYNAIFYPLLMAFAIRYLVPIFKTRREVLGPGRVNPAEVEWQRRRALAFPVVAIVLSCLGWLPGGVLFPLGISLLSEPVSPGVFAHFLTSFTISGLIATTYIYFGMQFFVLRIFYPVLWVDPVQPHQKARQELGSLEGRMRVFQFAAGLIPLIGAILMVSAIGDAQFTLLYRILVVGLIGMGMAGFGVALLASGRLNRTLAALTGSDRIHRAN